MVTFFLYKEYITKYKLFNYTVKETQGELNNNTIKTVR